MENIRYHCNAYGCAVTIHNVNAYVKIFGTCLFWGFRIFNSALQETWQDEWFRVNKRHFIFFVSVSDNRSS